MTRSPCSCLVLVLAALLAMPSSFVLPPRATQLRSRARAHSSVRMEAPSSSARVVPAAAATLVGLLIALSLGVDAAPGRFQPKETKAGADQLAQMECKTETAASRESEERLMRVRKKLREHGKAVR
eukprot:Skav215956  [mRNA]  locus=scaffold226:986674:990052:+ [translate_table: standard]